MKKVLSIILSLVMVIAALPLSVIESSATEYITSQDGEWIYYVDPNGDAVIYSGNTNSSAYLGSDTDVVVPSTLDGYDVVSIGQYTFSGNTNLQSIVLPNTLTTVSNHVFRNCSNLTSITLGSSVGIIGANAFEGCSSLVSLTIPNTVTTIGAYAFVNMTALKSITVPGSVTSVGDHMFEGCTALEQVVIGNGVSRLSSYMFHNCYALESITIPDSVTLIDYECFWNCNSLENVVLGNSVQTIGSWAFENCNKVKSITVPASLTSIGGSAFTGCSSLNAVYITDMAAWCAVDFGSYPLDWAHNLYLNGTLVTDLVIPDGVTEIKRGAFSGCTALTSVTMPDSVQSIGIDTFRNCTALESVTISKNLTSVGANAFENCNALTAVYVTDLEAWCVVNFADEDSNPLIKAHNLYVNNVLSTVTIPNTVTEIKQYVFAGIDNDVVLSDNVTSIGKCVFFMSTTDSVTLNDGLLSIGESAFNSNKGIVGIEIPDTVTSIGAYAFANMSALKSITVPGSVTSVGDHMFEGCTALEQVVIGNGVPRLSSYMFHNCYGLKKITVPNSVTVVDYECFWNCNQLTKVILPRSVVTISSWAFEGCSSLKYISIPDGVKSFSNNIFSGCSSVTNIFCYKDSYAADYDPSRATILGDMDFDGDTDIIDIDAMISAYQGNISLSEIQEIVADYDLDGVADGFDTALMDRTISKTVTYWTASESGYIMENTGRICTVNGRDYYKVNSGRTLIGTVTFIYNSIPYTGPILVSTDPNAVAHNTSYDSQTVFGYYESFEYLGRTWYVSNLIAYPMEGNFSGPNKLDGTYTSHTVAGKALIDAAAITADYINAEKGDVNQDGNTDLADYAMTKAHISGVAVDNNTPANLLDKSYLTAEYDGIKDNYPNGTIITQQYYCADYDGDKAVDAFDLFYLDKRINNIA